MENRGIVKVLILSVVTLGIYAIFWSFWTTKELKARGADIPTPWMQLIPIANIYFYYKYYMGAEQVTGGVINGLLYFLLAFFVTPVISMLLAQNEYNKLGGAPAPVVGGMPQAAPMGGMPMQPQQPMQAPMAPEAPGQNQNQNPPQPPMVQ